MADATPAPNNLDEAKIGKMLAWGIPAATLAGASVVGIVFGFATALLVCVGGALVGVIAILWSSLRVLSGDAPLPPELEELDRSAHSVDALAGRKKMLIRAIKDLENERDLGKLDDTDFEQLSSTYRAELKELLKRIDATLEPHRAKAEEVARAHLDKQPPEEKTPEETEKPTRTVCPKCQASNEPDAKFCKECATSLVEKTDADA
jgi:ribosomal protein L40E